MKAEREETSSADATPAPLAAAPPGGRIADAKFTVAATAAVEPAPAPAPAPTEGRLSPPGGASADEAHSGARFSYSLEKYMSRGGGVREEAKPKAPTAAPPGGSLPPAKKRRSAYV